MKRVNNQLLYYRLLVISIGIFFLGSCQKEINADAIKANSAMKANAAAGSTIVYTDVNPDISKSTSLQSNQLVYHLDLNNDGITDYTISAFHGSLKLINNHAEVTITPLHKNEVADSATFPLMMSLNSPISASLGWASSSDQVLRSINSSGFSLSSGGTWVTADDKFLALRLTLGNHNFYGWARLSVNVFIPNAASFTIKDYAYNSTPVQPILAGQTQ